MVDGLQCHGRWSIMGRYRKKGIGHRNIRSRVLWTMLIAAALMTSAFFLLLHLDLLLSYLISVSMISFIVFSIDKLQAVRGSTRLPEASLLTITILGGVAGSVLSMILFRHKIRKHSFWLVVIISGAVHSFIIFMYFFK